MSNKTIEAKTKRGVKEEKEISKDKEAKSNIEEEKINRRTRNDEKLQSRSQQHPANAQKSTKKELLTYDMTEEDGNLSGGRTALQAEESTL